jgi:putative membrane protein
LGDHGEMTPVRLMKIRSQLAFFTVIALCGPAYAQGLSAPEKAFVEKAAKGNLAEVELGKLASQKSNNAQVKAFGQQMITDHSKANDSLKPIADSAHVPWPTQLTGESKTVYDRLSKLSGSQFDKLYVQTMAQDHQKDAAEYRTESTKVKDPQLKTYITQTLPVVEQHLNHIKQIQPSVGASAKQ